MVSPIVEAARAVANKKKSVSGKWITSKDAEANRLLPKETDWKLPGVEGILDGRTRGKKNKLPIALLGRDVVVDETIFDGNSNGDDETEPSSLLTPTGKKKPTNSRIILEVNALEEAVCRNLQPCPQCGSSLEFGYRTCCLATQVKIKCSNPKCCYIDYGDAPAAADFALLPGSGSAAIERTTDFAINILYVLGFVASGNGGREAERLLGFLGLPNSTTMDRSSFNTIEKRIAPVLLTLLEEIMQENLIEEVRLTMMEEAKEANEPFNQVQFDNWKSSFENNNNNNNNTLPIDEYPVISVATDMGWQQRKESLSGHAFMVGHHTRKAIRWCLFSKKCRLCDRFKGDINNIPDHDCSKNWDGLSKAMEASAVLQMYVELYRTKRCKVGFIVSDDDTTMRSKLKWSNADYKINHNTDTVPQVMSKLGNWRTRPDKGRIPRDIPEPLFGADPNHRTKLVGKQVYALARRSKEDRETMTEMDAYRIKHNYGYMVRSIPETAEANYTTVAKAVVEHHFNNHEHCGAWCRQKDLTQAERQAEGKYYRCKVQDERLYKTIRTLTDTYMTERAMQEVAHGHDTQVNESLNNMISWHAPKNKVYSSSVSLRNRLAIAVGISSIGTLAFFTRLFALLGIAMTPDTEYFLSQRDTNRSAKIVKATTKETKKRRLHIKHEKLKENTAIAIKERAKREGTYKSGIGMVGEGYTEEDYDEDTKPKARTDATTPIDTSIVCSRCSEPGHKTAGSKKCKFFVGRGKNKRKAAPPPQTTNTVPGVASAAAQTILSPAQESVQRDADEADRLDRLPFDTPMPNDDESDGDSSGSEGFADAFEFYNEEEDNNEVANSNTNAIV